MEAPKRGPVPLTKEEKDAVDALKEESVTVSPIPYGQVRGKTSVDGVKAEWTKRLLEWPHRVMSFEVWCHMTCYDEEADHGGPAFQQLMALLLGYPSKADDHLKGDKSSLYWDADNEKYGDYFYDPATEPEDAINASGGVLGIKGDVEGGDKKWTSGGAHLGKSARATVAIGLGTHNYSGSSFTAADDGDDKPSKRRSDAITMHHYGIFGKLDWLVKCGVQFGPMVADGVKGGQSQGSGNAVVTPGHDTNYGNPNVTTCFEIDKCMSVMNSIAALYGLYYYPKCKSYNLEPVYQRGFKIRMRCPNPNYKWENEKLMVYEPLNSFNAAYLKKFMKHVKHPKKEIKYVGDGFEVPPLTRTMNVAHDHRGLFTPWSTLVTEGGKKKATKNKPERVIPRQIQTGTIWTGKIDGHYVTDTGEKAFERGRDLRAICKDVCSVEQVRGPDDKICLGFRMSGGLVLYPHGGDGADVEMNGEGEAVPYMTEPQRNDTAVTKWRFDEPRPLAYKLLNWDEWDALPNPGQWIDKLLGREVVVPDPVPMPTGSSIRVLNNPDLNVEAGTSRQPAPVDQAVTDNMPEVSTPAGEMMESGEQESTQAMSLDKDHVSTEFGTPGMSLLDTLVECNPEYADKWTEAQVKIVALYANKSQVPRQLKGLWEAMEECGLEMTGLEPNAYGNGECHRAKDLNKGYVPHWRTARHAPWSHEECYELAYYEAVYDRGVDQELYKKRYGSKVNLYTGQDDKVQKVDDVKVHLGVPKEVLYTNLLQNDDLHLRNFAKILCVYLHEGGFPWKAAKDGIIKADTKREMMTKGVGRAISNEEQPLHVLKRGDELVFPAVFRFKKGQKTFMNSDLAACLKNATSKMCEDADPDELEKALNACVDKWQDVILATFASDCKVIDWVHSPWHYETLPYLPQKAVFSESECWSRGCKRCSRRFYEYEYHVYADLNSTLGTYHWPNMLWKKWGEQNENNAPRPLHDSSFFDEWDEALNEAPVANWVEGGRKDKDDKRKHRKKPLPEQDVGTSNTANRDPKTRREKGDYIPHTMDWPGYALDLDALQKSWRITPDAVSKRFKELMRTNNTQKFRFRRYMNLAWRRGVNEKKTYPQSAMIPRHSKVWWGMNDHRLARSHKYGNVCRDCASVLDRAPGLFIRNSRYNFEAGLVHRNAAGMTGGESRVASDMHKEGKREFDGLMSQIKKRDSKNAEEAELAAARDSALQNLRDYINGKQAFPAGWTKLVDVPTIAVQGNATDPKKTRDEIEEAIQDLDRYISGEQMHNRENPVIKSIVRDAERRLLFNDTFQRFDQTRQFDSQIERTEHRNCVITVQTDGKWVWRKGETSVTLPNIDATRKAVFGAFTKKVTVRPGFYHNCLITIQWDPSVLVRQRDIRNQPRRDEDYRMEVFFFTRRGRMGDEWKPAGGDTGTMWRGDGYVTELPDDPQLAWGVIPERPLVQQRSLRQSRLFITYSLHRAITNDNYGRVILQKMADAIYELFGNDRWLSELITFGKRLASFNVGNMKGDNISRAGWQVIDHTRKDSAMEHFYGGGGKSSYVYDTYETHIDKVEVDAGVEIGPKMGHPHFHLLLTLNHFSYVHIDYFRMNELLEIMFRGVPSIHGWEKRFRLGDTNDPFYGDNERPYVDIKVYPQDDWKEVLDAYMRKSAGKMVQVISGRALPTINDK